MIAENVPFKINVHTHKRNAINKENLYPFQKQIWIEKSSLVLFTILTQVFQTLWLGPLKKPDNWELLTKQNFGITQPNRNWRKAARRTTTASFWQRGGMKLESRSVYLINEGKECLCFRKRDGDGKKVNLYLWLWLLFTFDKQDKVG